MSLHRRLKALALVVKHQEPDNRPSAIWLIGVEPGGMHQCGGGWIWDGGQYRQASQEETGQYEAQRVRKT